ncbi:hypothetical protein NDU88_007371 [Pleurodeles waltl]|uniref:Uncharacterized protein n=1 Tax=Pleurodeles waltl TaxID=8319 RepID=A0AAV7LXH6_PLEWA|nr:hypothetical protein NDU88_007371 [Pleurodeles waltl]
MDECPAPSRRMHVPPERGRGPPVTLQGPWNQQHINEARVGAGPQHREGRDGHRFRGKRAWRGGGRIKEPEQRFKYMDSMHN